MLNAIILSDSILRYIILSLFLSFCFSPFNISAGENHNNDSRLLIGKIAMSTGYSCFALFSCYEAYKDFKNAKNIFSKNEAGFYDGLKECLSRFAVALSLFCFDKLIVSFYSKQSLEF